MASNETAHVLAKHCYQLGKSFCWDVKGEWVTQLLLGLF